MSLISCDVVLLPEPKLTERSIKLSEALPNGVFVLKDGSIFSHASLYMLQLDADRLGDIADELKNIAEQTKKLSLKASRWDLNEELYYFDVEYERTVSLIRLQELVLAKLNPLRSGMRPKDIVRMKTADGLKRKNYEKYGFVSVGELFRPHITLTKFTDNPNIKGLPELSSFDGIFDRLGLFEMGDNGTCVRKLCEFELQ